MKTSGKIVICICSIFAVLAFLAGFYLLSEIKGNNNNVDNDTSTGSALNVSSFNIIVDIEDRIINLDSNATAIGSDEIVDTNRDENDEFSLWMEEFYSNNLWEKEFYNCMEAMTNSIEQRNTDDVLTPVEELQVQETIELYSASLLAYKSFVVNWVQREGRLRSSRYREDIFKQATLLMVLIADNYRGFSRESYEFIYDHGSSREELLSAGNEALRMENVIDEGARIIYEEFWEIDFWNERVVLEAAAWNAEFHNCMEKYVEMLVHENDDQVLRLWGDFVELWAENDALTEYIGGGSGTRYFMADRERECYRTATLLMIYQMEQNGLEYQFIYDIEADRDFLQKEYEWRK